MNTWVLSCLLVFIVALGLLVGTLRIREGFLDVSTQVPAVVPVRPTVVPTVVPVRAPAQAKSAAKAVPTVVPAPLASSGSAPISHEACPDMSDYIRKDEIPCWNCSL